MSQRLLTEAQIVACIVEAGCLGKVTLTYYSGPYEVTRTSVNADKLSAAFERALAKQADADLTRLRAECERLRVALRFYARGEHFIVSDCTAWDTVSGEPQNWQCDESGTATVEDGTIAAMVLRGGPLPLDEEDTPQPIEGERAALTGAAT